MHIDGVHANHLVCAYLGMVIFTLMKIEEDRRRGLLGSWKMWRNWIIDNVISIIISIISVPLILYIATDPLMREYFPISIPTSVLVGYQTQGVFRSLMTIAAPKNTPITFSSNGKHDTEIKES